MNLVLTIAIGDDYRRIASLTHPTFRAYADRIGASFHCISEVLLSESSPIWEKFQIYDLLGKYDRVLYVDTDILISWDAPDLFQLVPQSHLGLFEEGHCTDRPIKLIQDAGIAYGEDLSRWNGKYYNAGVIVASRCHREVFTPPEKQIQTSCFIDQDYVNLRIAKSGFDVFTLDHRFNHMSCTPGDRLKSYFIHYAGGGWSGADTGEKSRIDRTIDTMKKDLDSLSLIH